MPDPHHQIFWVSHILSISFIKCARSRPSKFHIVFVPAFVSALQLAQTWTDSPSARAARSACRPNFAVSTNLDRFALRSRCSLRLSAQLCSQHKPGQIRPPLALLAPPFGKMCQNRTYFKIVMKSKWKMCQDPHNISSPFLLLRPCKLSSRSRCILGLPQSKGESNCIQLGSPYLCEVRICKAHLGLRLLRRMR